MVNKVWKETERGGALGLGRKEEIADLQRLMGRLSSRRHGI